MTETINIRSITTTVSNNRGSQAKTTYKVVLADGRERIFTHNMLTAARKRGATINAPHTILRQLSDNTRAYIQAQA